MSQHCRRDIICFEISSSADRISVEGGNSIGLGLVGCHGGVAPPPDAVEISKNLKKFPRKLRKIHYSSIFFIECNKASVSFWCRWAEPTNYREILRNFRKFSKYFVRKLQKCIILPSISKNIPSAVLHFSQFGRKT